MRYVDVGTSHFLCHSLLSGGDWSQELVRGQRQLEDFRSQVVSQEELRGELRALSERNEALKEQMRQLQQAFRVRKSSRQRL